MTEWKAGKPKESGCYAVALYEFGVGAFGCDVYDFDTGWCTLDEDEIVGYIPIEKVMDAAKIAWPEHLTPKD